MIKSKKSISLFVTEFNLTRRKKKLSNCLLLDGLAYIFKSRLEKEINNQLIKKH